MTHEPHEKHEQLLFAEEVFQIQGAVFEVNRVLGCGFLEAVYQRSLALELAARAIPFTAHPVLRVAYKGVDLDQTYVPDFVCFGGVMVELKAVRELAPEHHAQVRNYLKASGLRVGLLVNFGCAPTARVHRFIM